MTEQLKSDDWLRWLQKMNSIRSRAEEVELLLNGESFGKLPAGEENRFKAIFDIVYQPGTLEAIGYTGGKETEHFTLQTAGEGKNLSVTSDRECIKANLEDLVYLNIALEDNEGILNTAIDTKVSVIVEGCGSLQGFGSANPASTENFYDNERTTFNGKALAIIRSGKEAGIIKVTVSAEGYESKTVEIEVA